MRLDEKALQAAVEEAEEIACVGATAREFAAAVVTAYLSALQAEPVAWTQPNCLEIVKEGGSSEMWAKRDIQASREMFDDPDMPEDVPLFTAPMPATVSEAMVERAARAMAECRITNDPRSFGFSNTVNYTAKRVSELVDIMWPRLKNEARAALETALAAGGRQG